MQYIGKIIKISACAITFYQSNSQKPLQFRGFSINLDNCNSDKDGCTTYIDHATETCVHKTAQEIPVFCVQKICDTVGQQLLTWLNVSYENGITNQLYIVLKQAHIAQNFLIL